MARNEERLLTCMHAVLENRQVGKIHIQAGGHHSLLLEQAWEHRRFRLVSTRRNKTRTLILGHREQPTMVITHRLRRLGWVTDDQQGPSLGHESCRYLNYVKVCIKVVA